MSGMVDTLKRAAAAWWDWTLVSTGQGALLLFLVAIALFTGKSLRPGFRYGLLLLVLLKFAVPPVFGVAYGFSDLMARATSNEPAPDLSTNLSVTVEPATTPVSIPQTAPVALYVPPAPTLSGLAWLLALESAGATLILALIARQWAAARRLVKRSAQGDHSLQTTFQAAVRAMKLRRTPRLCLSDEAGAPQSGGILRPFVLLPAWTTELPEDELQILLAHELAHVKRLDALLNGAQAIVQAMLWWNPAIWWLNRRIREEREFCCDELVLSHGIASGAAYSRTLVNVAERVSLPQSSWAMAGMADNFGAIDRRVRRALETRRKDRGLVRFASMSMLLLVAGWTLPGASDGKNEERDLKNEVRATQESLAKALGLKIAQLSFSNPVSLKGREGQELHKYSASFLPVQMKGEESVVRYISGIRADKLAVLKSDGKYSMQCSSASIIFSAANQGDEGLKIEGELLYLTLGKIDSRGLSMEGEMHASIAGQKLSASKFYYDGRDVAEFGDATIDGGGFDHLRADRYTINLETGAIAMSQGKANALNIENAVVVRGPKNEQANTEIDKLSGGSNERLSGEAPDRAANAEGDIDSATLRVPIPGYTLAKMDFARMKRVKNKKNSTTTLFEDVRFTLRSVADGTEIALRANQLEATPDGDDTSVLVMHGNVMAMFDALKVSADKLELGQALKFDFSKALIDSEEFGTIEAELVRVDPAARRFDILDGTVDEARLGAALGADVKNAPKGEWLTLPFAVARKVMVNLWYFELDASADVLPRHEVKLADIQGKLLGGGTADQWEDFKRSYRNAIDNGQAKLLANPALLMPLAEAASISVGSKVPETGKVVSNPDAPAILVRAKPIKNIDEDAHEASSLELEIERKILKKSEGGGSIAEEDKTSFSVPR